MREYLANMLTETRTLSVQEIALHIVVAAVLSAAIYLSY